MRKGNSTQLRVLHLVSSNGLAGSIQQTLFMPLLTKAPKQRIAAEVVCLAPDALPAAVLRQNGIPVHIVPLSRQSFSLGGFSQLIAVAREFAPDVIHAWGYTSHILAGWLSRRCGSPRVVMSASGTVPAAAGAGFFEQRKVLAAGRAAARADRMVFSSEAAAAAHRRVGFPQDGHAVIAPGVDQLRFKPDTAVRERVRQQLAVPPNAFVIGMLAPFQSESDHATFLKGIGELVKSQPDVHVLLAGHGVQKGNGPLMALIGSGNLASRTQLLGEWTDLAGFFNACDVVASTALTDAGRMNLAMAMACAVPCVATGVGEQGEVIGQSSIVIEPGSPAAVVRGISRVLDVPVERRAFLAKSARKHALKNLAQIRTLQQYLQLYFQLLGRTEQAEEMLPAPAEAAEPVAVLPRAALPPVLTPVAPRVAKAAQPANNTSLEAAAKEVIEWRPVPASAPAPQVAAVTAKLAEEQPVSDGDVLQLFESGLISRLDVVPVTVQAAPAKVEELEDLLAPELLAASAGEEFRPRQTAVTGGKSKASASAALSAAKATSSVRPVRVAAQETAGTSRAGTSTENRTDAAPAAAAARIAAARDPAIAPAAADAQSGTISDLDATLQVDVLKGVPMSAAAEELTKP